MIKRSVKGSKSGSNRGTGSEGEKYAFRLDNIYGGFSFFLIYIGLYIFFYIHSALFLK